MEMPICKLRKSSYKSVAVIVLLMAGAVESSASSFSWNSLQLDKATGIPGSSTHKYWLKGLATGAMGDTNGGFSTAHKVAVSGTGSWDNGSRLAEEKMNLSGDDSGSLIAKFQCDKDPWIYAAQCVYTGASFNSSGSGNSAAWVDFVKANGKPLSARGQWLQLATQLSAVSNPPPPPDPEKPKPTGPLTFEKAPVRNNNALNEKAQINLHPDLTLNFAEINIERTCQASAPVARITLVVKNAGNKAFPNLPGSHIAYLKKLSGLGGLTGGIEIGQLGLGESKRLTMPVYYQGADLTQLSGAYSVQLELNPLHLGDEENFANNNKTLSFNFSDDYCGPAIAPGIDGRLNTGTTLNNSQIAPTPNLGIRKINGANPQSQQPRPGTTGVQERGLNPQPEPPTKPTTPIVK